MRTTKIIICRAAILLLAMLLTATTAWAKAEPSHKIVVIADPHVMAPELLTNTSNTDWTTYIAGSRKLIDYSKALFDQTVTNISEMDEKPELVLIVGDLTKDGEKLSHDYVKGKLDELKTAGIPTLVIPGNHDLGTTDAKVYGETTTDAAIYTKDQLATLYADYGFGSAEREATTLTYACEPISGLVVIGIDSGKSGVLSETTLNWVCTKATAARAAGKQVIAMMHHPLIPHITGGDMFVETVSVANYATVRNRLADAGIRTIFTGHFHTSDIAKDWNADKTETIYDVTTGSLCSYPCDYRIVALNDDMTNMSILTSTATGGATISADAAKTRLTTVMTNMAKAKIQAKLVNDGMNATLAAYAANTMGPKMANAYVFHAEGNENSNDDAQTLLTELNSTFSSYPAYQALVTSMLQDKSNYGTDREDQTNDHELTGISMPVSVTPVDIKYLDPTAAIGQQRKTAKDALAITNSTTAIGSAGNETWYYVSGTVTNSNRIEVSGTVNLILEDGCNFTVSKGIQVASGNALNIYAQSVANCGKLKATATYNDAAIGGNGGDDAYGTAAGNGETSGDITIYGGIITTIGNIGGGNGGNGNYNVAEYYDEDNNSIVIYYPGYGGNGGNGNVTIYSGYISVSDNIGGGSRGSGQDESGQYDENNYGSNGGGTVNLSWANTEDCIYAYFYYGTVTLQKNFDGHAAGEVINNDFIKETPLLPAGTQYPVIIGSMPDGVTAAADLGVNANAVEGQVVTICFSGVPAGKVPVISVTYHSTYWDSDQYIMDIIDNGDGTFSFKMGDGNTTVTADAELKNDIKAFTASVPDQELSGYSYIYYKFEAANYPSNGVEIKETVKDGETTLTLGTHYSFGSVYYSDMSGYNAPYKVGDKCLVEINGTGDYAGTIYAPFTIIGAEVSDQTWGDLTWSLSNGALNIRLTDPANGNKSMPEESRENYPWYPFASYITSVTIQEDDVVEGEKTVQKGITSVGANAFQGTDGIHATNPNQHIATVSLPSTLTSIGEDAFAYCTGATITIPASVKTIGSGAFTEVLKVCTSLSDNADNTGLISLLSAAKNNDLTLQGRTLWKDGNWNTLCLPFEMTAEHVAAQLAGCTLMEIDVDNYYDANNIPYEKRNDGKYYNGSTEYDGDVTALHQTGFDATSGKLYLYFKDATSITAGKPYIIKWSKPDNYVAYNGENAKTCSDLVSPEFTGVKVWNYNPATKATTSDDGYLTFQGTYAPIEWTAENKSVLFLGVGKNNQNQDVSTLYYPNGTAKTTLGAFRAYFQLNNGLEVGTSAGVKEFKLSFGDSEDSADGIGEIDSLTPALSKGEEAIYNLTGQRLSKMQRGINIVNGKKIFK